MQPAVRMFPAFATIAGNATDVPAAVFCHAIKFSTKLVEKHRKEADPAKRVKLAKQIRANAISLYRHTAIGVSDSVWEARERIIDYSTDLGSVG